MRGQRESGRGAQWRCSIDFPHQHQQQQRTSSVPPVPAAPDIRDSPVSLSPSCFPTSPCCCFASLPACLPVCLSACLPSAGAQAAKHFPSVGLSPRTLSEMNKRSIGRRAGRSIRKIAVQLSAKRIGAEQRLIKRCRSGISYKKEWEREREERYLMMAVCLNRQQPSLRHH